MRNKVHPFDVLPESGIHGFEKYARLQLIMKEKRNGRQGRQER